MSKKYVVIECWSTGNANEPLCNCMDVLKVTDDYDIALAAVYSQINFEEEEFIRDYLHYKYDDRISMQTNLVDNIVSERHYEYTKAIKETLNKKIDGILNGEDDSYVWYYEYEYETAELTTHYEKILIKILPYDIDKEVPF